MDHCILKRILAPESPSLWELHSYRELPSYGDYLPYGELPSLRGAAFLTGSYLSYGRHLPYGELPSLQGVTFRTGVTFLAGSRLPYRELPFVREPPSLWGVAFLTGYTMNHTGKKSLGKGFSPCERIFFPSSHTAKNSLKPKPPFCFQQMHFLLFKNFH